MTIGLEGDADCQHNRYTYLPCLGFFTLVRRFGCTMIQSVKDSHCFGFSERFSCQRRSFRCTFGELNLN